ncbi:MAG TPA: hypothetical protein VK438_18880 [Xanthobacteraceae bacterium]|nr:hypothetical protein [Xanthobacteraceae bacterium]
MKRARPTTDEFTDCRDLAAVEWANKPYAPGREARMKRFLAAATIVAAALGPAYAGPKGDSENMLQKEIDATHKRETKDVDKAYNEMMKRTRTGAKPYDPWGSVRPAEKK